jgi:hypothetical protein
MWSAVVVDGMITRTGQDIGDMNDDEAPIMSTTKNFLKPIDGINDYNMIIVQCHNEPVLQRIELMERMSSLLVHDNTRDRTTLQ